MSTTIEWTQRPGTTGETWNPVVGCTKVSQGCKHCYAKALHDKRHKAHLAGKLQGVPQYAKSFERVQLMHDRLTLPLKWKKPRTVFVNSVSDLFHPDVPFEFIDHVFAVMALTRQHTYQILTKRPERMAEYLNNAEISIRVTDILPREYIAARYSYPDDLGFLARGGGFSTNVWLGTSVEDQTTANERIPHLLKCPAAVRFLSCEPLLEGIDLYRAAGEPDDWHWDAINADEDDYPPDDMVEECELECDWINYGSRLVHNPEYTEWKNSRLRRARAMKIGDSIHWVIAGGESGPGARPMHPDWARSLRDQCKEAGIPFFFKQWGRYAPGSKDGKGTIVLNDGGTEDYNMGPDVRLKYGAAKWACLKPEVMHATSKGNSGHLLDGREHQEWPRT